MARLFKKTLEELPQLEKFKEMKMMEVENLEPYKNDIIACYSEIRKVVKPTSTSKVLHLLCPEFFPMWDQKIRKNIREELKTVKINENGEGYYNFMCEMKKFFDRYNETINQLSIEHRKGKLKIIDEYLWMQKKDD